MRHGVPSHCDAARVVDLVVARHDERVEWTRRLGRRFCVLICTTGVPLRTPGEFEVPNRGREALCYTHHMLRVAAQPSIAAEVTVFVQARRICRHGMARRRSRPHRSRPHNLISQADPHCRDPGTTTSRAPGHTYGSSCLPEFTSLLLALAGGLNATTPPPSPRIGERGAAAASSGAGPAMPAAVAAGAAGAAIDTRGGFVTLGSLKPDEPSTLNGGFMSTSTRLGACAVPQANTLT